MPKVPKIKDGNHFIKKIECRDVGIMTPSILRPISGTCYPLTPETRNLDFNRLTVRQL